jgi:hypothetical protein
MPYIDSNQLSFATFHQSETAKRVVRVALPAALAFLSPLLVVDYLRAPAAWHKFFGIPWFASAMSAIATVCGLIIAFVVWRLLAPAPVVPAESREETLARLLRHGHVLEVRAAGVVSIEGEEAFDHLIGMPFLPLPVVNADDHFAVVGYCPPLVDLSPQFSGTAVTRLFRLFDAHADAGVAVGVTSMAEQPGSISLLVTRSDRFRITDDVVDQAEQKLQLELRSAFFRAIDAAEDQPRMARQRMPRALSLSEWDGLWQSFRTRLSSTERRPTSLFAPFRWTSDDARSLKMLPVVAYVHRPVGVDISPPTAIQNLSDAYKALIEPLPDSMRPRHLIYDGRAAKGWGGTVIDALVIHGKAPAAFVGEGAIDDIKDLAEAYGKDMGLTQIDAAIHAVDSPSTVIVHRVDDTLAEIMLVVKPS